MKDANLEASNDLHTLAERLVVPLADLNTSMLPLVGGKAANLGELIHAGLLVPDGFCVTTAAYRLIAEADGLAAIVREITGLRPADTVRLEECAAAALDAISRAAIPEVIAQAVRQAYAQVRAAAGEADDVPVAVRSSATAEDLPFASFAGQQDTYLNVVGVDAVLDAIRQCWASLWTYRAVSYRAGSNIDQSTVYLAVVVQRMVDAEVAGVLFTANPLTGKRRQAVMDASPGLGEAVVSGAVNPDHFVVDTNRGEIVEQRLGDKRVAVRSRPGGGTEHVELGSGIDSSSLTGEQVIALAQLGTQVEAHFGTPQDVEWAISRDGRIWLTQSRPITTLYPLPATAPTNEDDLRAYFSVNVAQGVFRPFTPMGIAAVRLMVSSGAMAVGFPPKSPVAGPTFLVDAGQRLFMDMTTLLRSVIGPEILSMAMSRMEARSGVVLAHLAHDPRFKPIVTPRPHSNAQIAWSDTSPPAGALLHNPGTHQPQSRKTAPAKIASAAARIGQPS